MRPRARQVGGAVRGVRGLERRGRGAGAGAEGGAGTRPQKARRRSAPGDAARRACATSPPLRSPAGTPGCPSSISSSGGGIVPGSMILIGGEPGIGKSTLLLQAAARLETAGRTVLYASGEESPDQLRLRADRLSEDAGAVHVLGETRLEAILGAAAAAARRRRGDRLHPDGVHRHAGERARQRGPGARVLRAAHALRQGGGTAVVVVGHVTKGGGIAGPKTLEHIVDTVLYFEGEATLDYRLLRTTKNRFGSVDELGVFSMTEHGLVPVPNPSARVPGRARRRDQRQRGHRADGGHPAGAGRGPGARRQVRLRHAAAGGHRTRSQAARRAARGAGAAGADLVRRPGRVRPGHRRRAVDASRAPIWPWPPRCSPASTTAPAPRTSSSSARSASAARSAPAAPLERRLAEAARLGFRRVFGSAAGDSRCRASPWSGWSTSSSWSGRLPRDVGVIVVAGGPEHSAGRRSGQAVPAGRGRAPGAPRAAAVRGPPGGRPPRARPSRRRRRRRRRVSGLAPWAALTLVAGGAERADSVAAGLAALRSECRDGPGARRGPALPGARGDRRGHRLRPRGRRRHRGAAGHRHDQGSRPRRPDPHRCARCRASRLWRAQTPQGFPRELLERAYAEAGARASEATDEAALVEACGGTVRLVPDTIRNLKVTTPTIWRWPSAWRSAEP